MNSRSDSPRVWPATTAWSLTTSLARNFLPFFWNVWISRKHPLVNTDDPWGWGRSLEWATSCPPPRHNYTSLPRIRSEAPAFDLHHPEIREPENLPRTGELFPELTKETDSEN